MEQKRPADIFQEALDYLWNGLGLEEKGWKRLKKGDFKKKMKNGLTYQIWFDRSRYNYIDYEIGHGNVEVGFTCIIKQGDDCLYSFKIEPTTGGSFFRMLTEDLRLDTGLLLVAVIKLIMDRNWIGLLLCVVALLLVFGAGHHTK